MRLPYILATLVVLASAGCRAPGADCRPIDGWQLGGGGRPAVPGCVNSGYRAAHELGRNLHELKTERAQLESRIAAAADDVDQARRRQRQIDVDIEAIQGLAVIEGWPIDPR